jgi:ribosomal protein L40E
VVTEGRLISGQEMLNQLKVCPRCFSINYKRYGSNSTACRIHNCHCDNLKTFQNIYRNPFLIYE